MAFQPNPAAFWQVIFGGFITIGGVLFAVSFAFGIETVKDTNGEDIIRFNVFFWYYLIVGLAIILLSMLGASVRFLGWPRPPRR